MRKNFAILRLLLPALLLIFGIYLPSFASIVQESFIQQIYNGHRYQFIVSLGNYIQFFTQQAYVNYFIITLELGALPTLFAIVLGYPLAYSIAFGAKSRWNKAILSIIIIMFWISPIVTAYAWSIMLSRTGIVNSVLGLIGLPPQDLIYNVQSVMMGITYFLIPFAVLVLIGPITNVGKSTLEAAKSLGAGELTTFFRVTLPLSMPGIISAALLCFALGVSAFVTPMVLGGGKIEMMSNIIFLRYTDTLNPYFASAMSIVLVSVVLLTTYALSRILSRWLKR